MSDSGGNRRDVELRIRATTEGSGFQQTAASLELLKVTLDKAEASAARAATKLADYRASLEQAGETSKKSEAQLARLVATLEKQEAALAKAKTDYSGGSEAKRIAAEKAYFAESLAGVKAHTAARVAAQQDLAAREAVAAKDLADFNARNRAKDVADALTASNVKREAQQAAQQAEKAAAVAWATEQAAIQKRVSDYAGRELAAATTARQAQMAARVAAQQDLAAREAVAAKALADFNAKNRQVEINASLVAFNEKAARNAAEIAKIEAHRAAIRRDLQAGQRDSKADLAEQTKTNKARVAEAQAHATALTRARGGGILSTGPIRGAGAPIGFLGLRPYELTNLGYQVNDVVSGLAMGQNATQILAQQGGQFIQIFGRAALRWLPAVAVAAGVAAVAIGSVTRTLGELASRREFTAFLTVTPSATAAGYTPESLAALRKELRDLGVDSEKAGQIIKEGVLANLSPERLEEYTKAARNMARVTGKDVTTAMKDLITGLNGGEDALRKLLIQYPALDEKERQHVLTLLSESKGIEAANYALGQMSTKFKEARDQAVSPLEESILKLSKAWGNLLLTLGNSTVITGLTNVFSGFLGILEKVIVKLDRLHSLPDFALGKLTPELAAQEAAQLEAQRAPALSTKRLFDSPEDDGRLIQDRLSIRQGVKIDSADLKQLVEVVREALKNPPEGVARAEITSGRADRKSGTRNHPEGHAIDYKLIDDQGNVIPGFMGVDSTGKYTAFAQVAKGVVQKMYPSRVDELESGTQYEKEDAGHLGFRAGGARGSRGPLAITPSPEQRDAIERATRDAREALAITQATRKEDELRTKEAQIRRDVEKEGGFTAEGTADRAAQDALVALRLKKESEAIDVRQYQQRQTDARQSAEDRRNALDLNYIREGGEKAVAAARSKVRVNYEDEYRIRKAGEAEARQELQRQRTVQDQLDTQKKATADLERGLLNRHKSALDQLNTATNLQYDERIKQIEKVGERQGTVDKAEIDALKQKTEELRKIALAANVRTAAETQANEALAARQSIISSYTKLEEAGEISHAEKVQKTKEAYDATRQAILGAADILENFVRTAKNLSETDIMKLTAQIKELRAETKYVNEDWKDLKKVIGDSLVSGVSKAFDTVAEAIGGTIAKTKTWKDVWVSLRVAAGQFFADLLKDIAKFILEAEAKKLFGGSGSGGGLSGFLASLITGGGSAATGAATAGPGWSWAELGVAHAGGTGNFPTRTVPVSWFANAPRYHSGYNNVVGLAPDEQAAIYQKGEEILSRDSPRNIMNGGGQGINIRNVLVMDEAAIPAAMAGAHGERTVLAHIVKNASTIRQVVKG